MSIRGAALALTATLVAVPATGADRVMGAASCAGAGCHGAAKPAPGARVAQNEFTVWERDDAHANAWRVLAGARGKSIAANLGLANAQEAPECLACHSGAVPPERQGRRYRVSEGVTCETCHGAAERWLAAHSAAGRSHTENLAAGMQPLADPAARAHVCLQCHFGGERAGHRLMSAGHPPLSFELDTFTAIQPAHFTADADWHQRKGVASGARTWVIGQIAAAALTLDRLAAPRAGSSLFPELSLYDCNACHHPPGRGAPATDLPPGSPRLAAVSLATTGQILAVLLPAAAPGWDAALRALHEAGGRDAGQLREAAGKLQGLLADARARLPAGDIAPDAALALLKSVAERGEQHAADLTYAEASAMALGALANHLAQAGGKGGAKIRPALDAVFAAVADRERYEPARFARAARKLRETAVAQFGGRS